MSDFGTARTTWQQQGTWSAVAGRLKREITRARTLILSLIVTTAILETLAAELTHAQGAASALPRAIAIAGAVLAALAATLQSQLRGRERIQQWTRARSTSEGLKEQIYRYLTKTGKYATDAEAALIAERQRILDGVGDLQSLAATVTVPTKDLPTVSDVASYVKLRVEGQVDGYYRKQATANARRGAAWRRAQFALLLASAVIGALVAFLPDLDLGAWVSVITTVAGAFGAHIEASRCDHLAISYQTTASRLEALRDEWNDRLAKKPATAAERDNFVDRCEEAISVENEGWMAGWVKKE